MLEANMGASLALTEGSNHNAPSIPRHSGRQPVATRAMIDRIASHCPTTLLPNILRKACWMILVVSYRRLAAELSHTVLVAPRTQNRFRIASTRDFQSQLGYGHSPLRSASVTPRLRSPSGSVRSPSAKSRLVVLSPTPRMRSAWSIVVGWSSTRD
jgi:hypothetical protein